MSTGVAILVALLGLAVIVLGLREALRRIRELRDRKDD